MGVQLVDFGYSCLSDTTAGLKVLTARVHTSRGIGGLSNNGIIICNMGFTCSLSLRVF